MRNVTYYRITIYGYCSSDMRGMRYLPPNRCWTSGVFRPSCHGSSRMCEYFHLIDWAEKRKEKKSLNVARGRPNNLFSGSSHRKEQLIRGNGASLGQLPRACVQTTEFSCANFSVSIVGDEREKRGINRKCMWDKHRAEYIQKETKQR